jgi:hypothetical protein
MDEAAGNLKELLDELVELGIDPRRTTYALPIC